jgi:acetyl esterase
MTRLVLASVLALAASGAAAQMSSMPAEVRAGIAGIGPVWGPEVLKQTVALYQPILKVAPRQGVRITTDLAYGAHEQQKLDLAQPEAGGSGLPVLVFFPGGGFATSNRNVDGLCCHNLLTFFAQRGVLALAASYRTAPANPWPAGSQDVGAAVSWAKANAAKYGGDPKRVFVFGHSAGAFNTASYVFDPAARPDVAGAILMSGPHYRIVKASLSTRDTAYLGEDERRYAERSPVAQLAKAPRIPTFLVYAEYDPPLLAAPSLELAQALCVRDKQCPDVFMLRGHNHLSPSLSFNTPDVELGNRVLAFIDRARRF